MKGLIHIYCGEGKGKTTAAVGLAVRAAGSGMNVLFAQFHKDGSSPEISVLKCIAGVKTMALENKRGFFYSLGEDEKKAVKEECACFFEKIIREAENDIQLIVFDEIISACNNSAVCEEKLVEFLKNKKEGTEVVMTGRNPSEKLLEIADYVTEMKKIAHPYDRGIAARRGIEF